MQPNSKAARLTNAMPAGSPDRQKWAELQRLPERDATTEEIQALAGQLNQLSNGNEWRYCILAQCIARDWIRYESDTKRTGGEDIAGITRPYAAPLEAVDRGADDCDAKARLFAALCLARQRALRANLVPWWDPADGSLAHVSAIVWIANAWHHVETILSRARLGESFHCVPADESGEWRYS